MYYALSYLTCRLLEPHGSGGSLAICSLFVGDPCFENVYVMNARMSNMTR